MLAANGVDVRISQRNEYTPTPAVSHAILVHNRGRATGLADGIVVTPSHNPPEDGGFKYNPPNGGPADTSVTRWIEDQANALLEAKLVGVKRIPFAHRVELAAVEEAELAEIEQRLRGRLGERAEPEHALLGAREMEADLLDDLIRLVAERRRRAQLQIRGVDPEARARHAADGAARADQR